MEDSQADIAVIGMAVMGQNLILNMADHGYKVVGFNRTLSKVDDFVNGPAQQKTVVGAHSAEEMAKLLKRPRRIMLMVRAGDPVDETIEHILPYLEPGDIIIDGGNSQFEDTVRRLDQLKDKGILYLGVGISGGEEGARHGPAIMPGGSADAWPHVKDIFQAIAAKGDHGQPCCEWIGDGGAGHYVKMVHNGIEYGDMQLISEAYAVLKSLGLTNHAMSEVFRSWNKGQLDSYLIQITADILDYQDEQGDYIVDKILDRAGQKGTGKWTIISAADLGQPVSVIAEALLSRFTSELKDERLKAAQTLKTQPQASPPTAAEQTAFITNLGKALYAAKIVSYAQGYMLMRAAAQTYNWQINYAGVASIWTGGCIIRSRFLADISSAYASQHDLNNLMLADFFVSALRDNESAWRKTVTYAVDQAIPVPGLASALTFFDAYRSAELPANLIQAQRDYFGAHTYERVDKPRGQFFHTNWTGTGGQVSSSNYDA